MSSNNIPAGIAMQVVPTFLWGDTGAGKTSTTRALMQKLGRTFIHMNLATSVPEDVGGFPNPDYDNGVVRMMPPSWVLEMADGNGAILLDELTCTQPATLAGALTLLSDNMVGEYRLPDSTIKVAAANPPELAPNAMPMPASIRSRFYHHEWEIERETLLEGFRNGCQWKSPDFPIVPDHWEDNLPYCGALVEQFLRSHPDSLSRMPKDDLEMAFPNPRGYEFVTRAWAAAKACGYNDTAPVVKTLVQGCIGKPEAAEFMKFLATLDLIDPEAILSGREEYEYTDRIDLNICLLTSLIRQLRSNNEPDRWVNAASVFLEIGRQGEIETCLMCIRQLLMDESKGGVRPNNFMPPQEVLAGLMEITNT